MNRAEKVPHAARPRRFKPYPAYKASGVEWLGDVPAGWAVQRLRASVSSCQNGVWGDEPDGVNDVPCVRVADFDRVAFRVNLAEPTLRSIEKDVVSARGLRSGDLLLEKSGGGENQPVGAVVEYDHDTVAVCSNFIARMTIAAGFDARFLTYLHAAIYALRLNRRSIKQSTGIQNLDSASYLWECAAFPAVGEQRAIAAFLDRETAEIDALVAKEERLIELLQEKHTALITRAVTQGLDPTVPMKDSGVEWLGEIPAHWKVKRLKQLGAMQAGTAITSESIEPVGEYPVFGGNGVRGYTESFTHDGQFPLIGRQGALCGCVNFATGKFWASEHAVVVTPRKEVDPRWLVALLQSMSLNTYSQSAAQPGLAVETIGAIHAPQPSQPEQRAIAAFLDRRTARADALIAKILKAIERLKEFRTALISAAVTGKIDVREQAKGRGWPE